MGERTKIEWCDHTFNPWIGCQKVSPGCDFCYAEALMDTRYHRVQWGPHGERVRTSRHNWNLPLRWARRAVKRERVFCASLADWLDNKVPSDWRVDLAKLIHATPQLDWLLLTKRIENFTKLSPFPVHDLPPNVWLGVTCEDQERFNQRWPVLERIPAVVRFISYEPAIGPLTTIIVHGSKVPDWIICGGESGPQHRRMPVEWPRYAKRICNEHGVPFFMKQMAGRAPIPNDLQVKEFPNRAVYH